MDYNYNSYNEDKSPKFINILKNRKFLIILGGVLVIVVVLILIFSTSKLTDVMVGEIPVLYVGAEQNVDISASGKGSLKNTLFSISVDDDNYIELSPTTYQGKSFVEVLKPQKVGDTILKIKALSSDGSQVINKEYDLVICKHLDVSNVINKDIVVDLESLFNLDLGLGDSDKCYAGIATKIGNNSIISVNEYLNVKGLKEGVTSLTLSEGDQTINYNVTVVNKNAKIKVDEIKIISGEIALKVGKSKTIDYYVLPANASDKTVYWSTTKSSVASVNQNGVITASGAGTATIIGMAMDGSEKKAEIKVTVTK